MKNLTEITIDKLKKVTSGDDLKPAMKGVYFDKKGKRIVATDGHKLICYEAKPDKGDKSAIIPIDAFDRKFIKRVLSVQAMIPKEYINDLYYKVEEKYTFVYFYKDPSTESLSEEFVAFKNIPEKYLDFESVLKGFENKKLSNIGINPSVAKSFLDAFPKDTFCIELKFDSEDKAIYAESKNTEFKTYGVLMPCMIMD